MKVSDWEDYACFTQVARHGGLRGAADALGLSVPTLSRRMRAFETRIGRRLFLHGGAGYQLTAEGRALWERTERMEAAAVSVDLWRAEASGPVPVRISAGTWTALLLSQNLSAYWSPEAIWVPELVHSERVMDLARREIDIGMRNARPDQPWLAGRRLGSTIFCAYAAAENVSGWIGPDQDAPLTRSQRWILDEHRDRIVTRANAPLLAMHMARAGIGRVVLPVEVGDLVPDLMRVSAPIDALESERWLVSHQDARHDPPIRGALDAIAGFFLSHSAPPVSAVAQA